MDASINSSTAVTDYLGMPVMRFYETWEAICDVYERRAQKRQQAAAAAKASRPGRKRHRR